MKKMEFKMTMNGKEAVSLSFEDYTLDETIEEFLFFLEHCGYNKNQIANAIIRFESMEHA